MNRALATYVMEKILKNLVFLGEDGVHLSDKEKTIFGSKLSNLIRRALNYSCRGWESSNHCALRLTTVIDALGLE